MPVHDNANKQIPVPVQQAHAALEILRAENPALAQEVAKILPAFAMRMEKSGGEVTVESLLAAALRGASYLNNAKDSPQGERTPMTYCKAVHAYILREAAMAQTDNLPPLYKAALAGDTVFIKDYLQKNPLEEGDIDFRAVRRTAMQRDDVGMLDVIYAAQPDRALKDLQDELNGAIRYRSIEAFKFLWQQKNALFKTAPSTNNMRETVRGEILREAVVQDNVPVLEFLYGEIPEDILNVRPYVLVQGHEAGLKYLASQGMNVTDKLRQDLVAWISHGPSHHSVHQLKALHETFGIDLGAFFRKRMEYDRRAYWDIATLEYLQRHKVDISDYLNSGEIYEGGHGHKTAAQTTQEITHYAARAALWRKKARCEPPDMYCAELNPAYFRPLAFEALLPAIDYGAAMGKRYAYHTAALFGTAQRVWEYMERWSENANLHDAIYAIIVPSADGLDLKSWGDAVLRHGPAMAKLVKYADRMKQPAKTADGKGWSLSATREKIAAFAYKNGKLNPALAALCLVHAVEEKDFETARVLLATAPADKNIPDIRIDGGKFGMPGAEFVRLAANDVHGPFLGEIVDCCQSIGGAGDACARHGVSSEDSGFYVVRKKDTQEILSQTWAWRGKKGELCFDSLETLGSQVEAESWKNLLDAFGKALAKRKSSGIAALHVGTGGDTPRSLRQAFQAAAKPAQPKNYDGYRDSHDQIVAWKRPAP